MPLNNPRFLSVSYDFYVAVHIGKSLSLLPQYIGLHSSSPSTPPSSVPSSSPNHCCLPSLLDPLLLFSIRKSRPPRLSTEHSITRYKKSRYKPSYQGWRKELIRRKGSQEQGKVRATLTPPVRNPTKPPS